MEVVDAKPIYSFTLFVLETRSSLAFALENTAGFRQLQPLIVLQLSFFFLQEVRLAGNACLPGLEIGLNQVTVLPLISTLCSDCFSYIIFSV